MISTKATSMITVRNRINIRVRIHIRNRALIGITAWITVWING